MLKTIYYCFMTFQVLFFCFMLFLFEKRKNSARQLILCAYFCALAVAGRIVFVFVPFFNPIIGIIIIGAVALGPVDGFVIGSMAALCSNFVFGQGSWTICQMFGYGLCGFLMGLLSKCAVIKKVPKNIFDFILYAFFSVLFYMCLAGPILDFSSIFMMGMGLDYAKSIMLSGIPYNFITAISTAVTVLILSYPVLKSIERVKQKYFN